jgi:dTDP-4-amino-4,6-dideoxygalactose transaminase
MHAHLENADKAGSEILALPIHQALADVDAERIGNLVRHVLAGS